MSTAKQNKTSDGQFVLKNRHGQVIRAFSAETQSLILIYREDNRRVEAVSDLTQLEDAGVKFQVLNKVTRAQVQKKSVAVGDIATLEFLDGSENDEDLFSAPSELAEEKSEEKFRTIFIRSAVAQVALVVAVLGLGTYFAPSKALETQVTVIPQAIVDQMIKQQEKQPEAEKVAQHKAARVVAPAAHKVAQTRQQLPKIVAPMKNHRVVVASHQHARGGFKGQGKMGFGTNEANMNSIGALSALDHMSKSGRGNGGSGGLNLAAVGNGNGSGAGGKGYGGFGSNGAGGHGKGGLGGGGKQGLANAMYGKGLIAAPFGEGSAAPGVGGYGTRGRMGGGAAGAGYGRVSMVGSSKGLGPKGNGPAGSGGGGSGYGWADADSDGMEAQGGLDKDQIAEVILRHQGEITYCYEQGLQVKPDISGRVAVKFLIGPGGRVTTAGIQHSSVRSSQVEGCIVRKLQAWNFPHPSGGVSVKVTYPFILRRVGSL
jgi:hypothetical protein